MNKGYHKPEPVRKQNIQIAAQTTELYSGPIPKPEDLAKYNQIHEGFAERLIIMAEKEQNARIELTSQKVTADIKLQRRDQTLYRNGQYLAFLSVIIVVALCGMAFYLGYPDAAKWIAVSVICSLAGIFILKRKVIPNKPH